MQAGAPSVDVELALLMKESWLMQLSENPRASELGEFVRGLKREKGAEGVMAFAQAAVNRLAPLVADKFPEIAQRDPKQVGQFSKACTLGFILAAAQF